MASLSLSELALDRVDSAMETSQREHQIFRAFVYDGLWGPEPLEQKGRKEEKR